MKNAVLLVCLVALIGCGKSKKDNDIAPPGKIPNSKLNPAEKADWEEFIVQTGRIVRSAVSSANAETEAVADPILDEMRALVKKNCTVSNAFGSPAVEAAETKFTVSGANCPITISVVRKMISSDSFEWSISMNISDQELADKNLVQTIRLKGRVTRTKSSIVKDEKDLYVSIEGSILSASGGSVSYLQSRRDTNVILNKREEVISQRVLAFQPTTRPRPIALIYRKAPNKVIYNLQGEILTEADYRSYLSDLGFLLSGVPTDAG